MLAVSAFPDVFPDARANPEGYSKAKANADAAAGRAAALREVFTELEGVSTHKAAAELDRRGQRLKGSQRSYRVRQRTAGCRLLVRLVMLAPADSEISIQE
jgi:hypothetical protein